MGTHPIFESDFDCLTEVKPCDRHALRTPRCYATTHRTCCSPTIVGFCSKSRYRHGCQVYRCWCGHRRRCWIWSRYWNSVRFPDHRLCSQPVAESSIVLVRHLGVRLVRSHGTLLLDGCLPHPIRPINTHTQSYNISKQKHSRAFTNCTTNLIYLNLKVH